jgi:uncharacterized protein (DUF2267 family)
MTTEPVTPFESTLHTSNTWLTELMDELGWQDRHRAYQALRVVLHTLRDRLTVKEVADLGAQLPMLIRGMYYEGWRPTAQTDPVRKKEAFLAPIAAVFRDDPQLFPEGIAWAVFKLLKGRVSAGEIDDVKHLLSREVRSLWPEGEVAHVN